MDCCNCNTGRDRDTNHYVQNRSQPPNSNVSISCCEKSCKQIYCDRNIHHIGASNATPMYGAIGNGKSKVAIISVSENTYYFIFYVN